MGFFLRFNHTIFCQKSTNRSLKFPNAWNLLFINGIPLRIPMNHFKSKLSPKKKIKQIFQNYKKRKSLEQFNSQTSTTVSSVPNCPTQRLLEC